MKTISPLIYSCVLAVTLASGMGCARKADDAKISSDVQGKFSQDSGLSDKQISVQASNGTVTLAGTVQNDGQRDAASRQAASVAGVKQVINNLQVGSMADARATESMRASNKAENPKLRRTSSRKSGRSDSADSAKSDAASDSGKSSSADTTASTTPPVPASVPAETAPQPTPPLPPKRVTIEQGTQLTVRLVDNIDSEKNQTGDTFHATLNTPLSVDGTEIVPAGSDVTGHLAEVKSAGKFAGQSIVVAQLDSITSGGKAYNIQTDQYKKQGSSRGKNTAEKVGGGAAIGAIIGAIAGGGKGAAIGAAAGGGIGGGVQAATKSQQIKLPSETVLNFTLQAPVTVLQASSPNGSRPKLPDSQ